MIKLLPPQLKALRLTAQTILALFPSILLINQSVAQSTDASILGRVTDTQSQPLPGATVLVKNESTGFTAATATTAEGKFSFSQLPLGKPYSVTVSFVSYRTEVRNGLALNQGDKVTLDFGLAQAATELEQVVVESDNLINRVDRLGASTAITANEIAKIPVQNRNFTDLASLAPTVNGLNIGGQRRTGTNITIDGVNARNSLTAGEVGRGPYSISMEAIREFEVATNVYDVTQGRQAGGALNAVTKFGTNTFMGTLFTYHRADWLASPYDIRGNKRTNDFSNTQYGFSLGGPIIKDKMHFFVALDRQNEARPFFIADIQSPDDENALRINRDSLSTLLGVMRGQYGLGSEPQVGAFDRKTVANTLFARIDWQLSPKHRLTFRNNYSDWNNPNSVDDNQSITLYESWSSFSSRENSTLLSLRSTFRPNLLNEFKVQYQHAQRHFEPSANLPAANIPRGIVRVRSVLPNGSNGNVTVQFGGQRFTPEENLEQQIHLVNTSYLTAGKYTFTFGSDNLLTYLDTYISNEQNGRFFFESLDQLRTFRPERYARQVPLRGRPDVQQYVLDAAAFGQVQFNPVPDLTTSFGLRWDVTSFLTAGDYNPVVDRELGLRTDHNPTDWNNIQPRLQLSWNVKGQDRNVVRFGAGVFSSQPHYYAHVNHIQNSGTNLAEVDVRGDAVPYPDFDAFRRDPSTAPGVPAGAPSVSTINLIGKDFQVPTTYKANLAYSSFLRDWLRVGVNLLYSRTVNNYHYFDRNLVDAPFFTLAKEDDRPVFVPASTITNRGLTNYLAGRKSDQVGRVLELTSPGVLNQKTLILDAEARLPRDGSLSVSYTLNETTDNTSYNCCVANTATFLAGKGDPRRLVMANSDNDFRHKLVVYGTSPSLYGFFLSGRYNGIGGTRYSFLVNQDINGDFSDNRNDLAYVFDPANPELPTAISASLEKVLSNPGNRALKYVESSLGGIADRNGGSNPFFGTIDLRLSKTFKTFKTQSLELSADVFNFANLLNKNWGGNYNLGNQNLLFVDGFDQASRNYRYRVNENVGVTQRSGTPYQIQLGARYAF